jgi:cell division protease FtsH
MVLRYGMSEKLGLVTFEPPGHSLFPAAYSTGEREYSEETARIIDGEIRQLLEAAHARVRQTLAAKRAVLDALAKLLIEQEVVDRAALAQFLSHAAPA